MARISALAPGRISHRLIDTLLNRSGEWEPDDLNELRTFRESLAWGSLSFAARNLGMAPT